MVKVNYTALLCVFQDCNSSDEDLIMKAGITSFHVSRLRTPAEETFKIAYGHASQVYRFQRLQEKISCKLHFMFQG